MVLNLIPAPASLQEDLDPRTSLPVRVAAVDLDDERLTDNEAKASVWARTRDRATRTRGTDVKWLVPQDFALRAGDRVLAVDGNLVPTPGSRSRPSAPDGPDPPSSSPWGATAGASACPSGWLPASLAPLRR
ncbi:MULTISPECIES: hypothetical protein [Streptomyces]|uniref:hypothetical protein n=1 Tax=Streptomyces TaxID=1883 RepID=UPI000FFF4930|nr:MULTISPECIES: hypothetical protein [Streptomyces]